MHAVTGPLQTGTYVIQIAERPGQFHTVKEDRSGFALTRDSHLDGAAKVSAYLETFMLVLTVAHH